MVAFWWSGQIGLLKRQILIKKRPKNFSRLKKKPSFGKIYHRVLGANVPVNEGGPRLIRAIWSRRMNHVLVKQNAVAGLAWDVLSIRDFDQNLTI